MLKEKEMLPPKNIPVQNTSFLTLANFKKAKVRKSKITMIKVSFRTFSSTVYFGNPLFKKVLKKALLINF
jgi:hypothetical protein